MNIEKKKAMTNLEFVLQVLILVLRLKYQLISTFFLFKLSQRKHKYLHYSTVAELD